MRRTLTEEKRAEETARGVSQQNLTKRIKVGHTGTLDPFATGLLILLSGKKTREAEKFSKLDKEYVAEIRLGATSTTGDPEGEISFCRDFTSPADPTICATKSLCLKSRTGFRLGSSNLDLNHKDFSGKSEGRLGEDKVAITQSYEQGSSLFAQPLTNDCDQPTLAAIEKLLQEKFTGEITQTPPIYSAIKIDGRRAYQLARKGETPQMPPRQVNIYSMEILDYDYPTLKIRAHVSSGTYIRTLAEDIGRALGCGAYTTELRRTKVGKFDVEQAAKIEI